MKFPLAFASMILVWSSAHVWVAWRLRQLLALGKGSFALLLGLMLALGFSYVPARLFGRSPFLGLASALEATATVWMAFFIVVMLLLATLEGLNLLLRLLGLQAGSYWARLDPARGNRAAALALLLATLCGLAAAHLAALSPRLVTLRVDRAASSPSLTPAEGSQGQTRLLFLSDLHLGTFASDRFLAQALELGVPTKPHAILLGGDIIEHPREDTLALLDRLLAAFPGRPFFLVVGNHEVYGKLPAIEAALATRPQVTVLRNRSIPLAPGLRLAGVDDRQVTPTEEGLPKALAQVPPEDLLLLLWHRPGEADLLAGRPGTVVLSGHTHGGQLFPMTLLAPLANGGFRSGLYQLGPRSVLHVSNGAALWGPPIRIGARPDLVLLELATPPGDLAP